MVLKWIYIVVSKILLSYLFFSLNRGSNYGPKIMKIALVVVEIEMNPILQNFWSLKLNKFET